MNIPLSDFDETASCNKFMVFSSAIQHRGIWFKDIELDYRSKQKLLLVRLKGSKSMCLSNNYVKMVQTQLEKLESQSIFPLISKIRTNFIMKLKVNSQGLFSFSKFYLKIKVDCRNGIHMRDAFHIPFKILLPFALQIKTLYFRGHKHKVSGVEADIELSINELNDIVNKPIVAPRAEKQWYNIASFIYEEAKHEYKYDVEIPIIEGEMNWDNKVETIQLSLPDNSRVAGLNI